MKRAAWLLALLAAWYTEQAVFKLAKRLGFVKPEPHTWEGKETDVTR